LLQSFCNIPEGKQGEAGFERDATGNAFTEYFLDYCTYADNVYSDTVGMSKMMSSKARFRAVTTTEH